MRFTTRAAAFLPLFLLTLAAALLAVSCGSDATTPSMTLGEVFQKIVDSPGPDSDGDGIPDDVEHDLAAQLHTDPNRADTDGDGMDDLFEVFGPAWIYVETDGQAGTLDEDAPVLTGAANAMVTNEHAMVDSDGDGVTNYLEFHGYRYDWMKGEFVQDADGYKTDPMQWSTDQDAYSDGMEVSGLNMDVAVVEPGNHPLVPAYPNIVIELTGYTVTLNETVTYSRGGSLAQGESWSRETTSTETTSSHLGFEIGASYTWGVNGGASAWASTNFGWEWTDTTSVSVAAGGSINEEINWNRARCYNPTEAAHLKLFLKVHNRGTAPATNVIPTLSLSIGGASVATFEPANAKINMLLPGATYPQGDATFWVVSSVPAGNASTPLALTDFELRALESGAPVTISVAQKEADVMRFGNEAWERVGDINEYVGRCVAVSSNLVFDVGPDPETGELGNLLHYLVYADDSPTAPRVTLRDAMTWSMGLQEQNGVYTVEYIAADGTPRTVTLDGNADNDGVWRYVADRPTLENNWPTPPTNMTTDEFLQMRLGPNTHVLMRAPRPLENNEPRIYSAYVNPLTPGYEVVACVEDYDGVQEIVFVDKDGNEIAMEPDGRGPLFYSCTLEDTYEFAGNETEKIRVTGIADLDADGGQMEPRVVEWDLEFIHTPTAQAPLIRNVRWDSLKRRLYAEVEPGGDLAEDQIAWVRVFHDSFVRTETQEEKDGYASLERPVNWFEDEFGWERILPGGWRAEMRLVAYTAGGQYTAMVLENMQNLLPYTSGTVTKLKAEINWYVTDEWWIRQFDMEIPEEGSHLFNVENDDFDDGWPATKGPDALINEWKKDVSPGGSSSNWLPKYGLADVYIRSRGNNDHKSGFRLGFHAMASNITGERGTMTARDHFNSLTRSDILERVPDMTPGRLVSSGEAFFAFGVGHVMIFLTNEGRHGKLIITDKDLDDGTFWNNIRVSFDYVVFREPGDGDPPTDVKMGPKTAYTFTTGEAIESIVPTYTGTPPDTFTVSTDLPPGLTINEQTGVISGTPTSSYMETQYTVTAANTGGAVDVVISLTVLDPPSDLSYATPLNCPTGHAIAANTPTLTGDADAFTISPALPAGLSLDENTGVLSGTPTAVTAEKEYTVTATNEAGASTTATVNLATPLGAPDNLTYDPASVDSTVGTYIVLDPTVAGGEVASYSITPALPDGLELDTTSGVINGSPTAASSDTYTVTAANAAGFTSVEVTITIN